MATALQFRRGTTLEISSQTGLVGELFVDTTKDTIVVMDGSTAGGFPLARESALSGYATTSALSAKQDTLVSGTSIKTINGTSLLGSGDITISGGSSITDTDDLTEGSTNLYYTDTRVGAYLTANNYATESYVDTALSDKVNTAGDSLTGTLSFPSTYGIEVGTSGDGAILKNAANYNQFITLSGKTGVLFSETTTILKVNYTDIATFGKTSFAIKNTSYSDVFKVDTTAETITTAYPITGYATETYVNTAISNLVDSAPAALDTLNELAAALGDDANYATTVTNALAAKAPLASPSFTGNSSFVTTTEALNVKVNPTGTVDHDCSTGSIWYYYLPAGDVTVNLTNMPSALDRVFVVTIVISQGSTARLPLELEINGASAIITWAGGSPPSGNASKIDVVSFAIMSYTGGAGGYTVLGELSTYG